MSEHKGPEATPEDEQSTHAGSASHEKLPGEASHDLGVRAMKAFAHPLRMSMYTYLSDHGAATSTTLAQHLGESTGQTSYHLRQLEKHGLVEEDPGRGTGRERWWKPVGFTVRRAFVEADSATAAQLDLLVDHQLQDRLEKLRTWLGRSDEDSPAWREASVDTTSTARMTATQAHALSRELMEVVDRHTTAARQDGAGEGADSDDVSDEGTGEEDARRVRIYVSAFPLDE